MTKLTRKLKEVPTGQPPLGGLTSVDQRLLSTSAARSWFTVPSTLVRTTANVAGSDPASCHSRSWGPEFLQPFAELGVMITKPKAKGMEMRMRVKRERIEHMTAATEI